MDLNWQQQLWESALWLARAFGISSVALALAAMAVARWTDWGRKFWRLAWPYLTPRQMCKRDRYICHKNLCTLSFMEVQ